MTKKLISRFIAILSVVTTLLYTGNAFSGQSGEVIPLQEASFSHIQFKKIKANSFNYQRQQLQIKVDDSASILMLPFQVVKPIKKVSFEWRSVGKPLIKNAKHELERDGDDAVFKLGLLLKAESESMNPFVASWLKQVRQKLQYPSEEMIYLVVDAKHKANERWPSPYNKRITMISVESKNDESGWNKASYEFKDAQQVVALWLMADGDNTHSRFNVSIKNVILETY